MVKSVVNGFQVFFDCQTYEFEYFGVSKESSKSLWLNDDWFDWFGCKVCLQSCYLSNIVGNVYQGFRGILKMASVQPK